MDKSIIKRDLFEEIVKYLNTDNILVLHGARQVGKTYILYYLNQYLHENGEATFYLDLEDSRMVETLNSGVETFLSFLSAEGVDFNELKRSRKKLFVFIDEVQYLSSPSSFLKLIADHHPDLQLIVSGSSSFDIKTKFSDSLVGRTVNFEVYPLNFSEFLHFKGLNFKLKQEPVPVHLQKLTSLYEEYINFGGYPKIVLENSLEKKEKYLQQIIDTYIKKDIRDLANIKDAQKFNNLLKVLASQSGSLLNTAQLSRTCGLSVPTINNYLFILEKTYIIKLLSPFSSSAKVEIVKSPKVFFFDTGLLKMLWLKNLQTGFFGNVLETSVFSELSKKYNPSNLNFWRSKGGNEIDFILQEKGGILPIEVKSDFSHFSKKSMEFFLQKYHQSAYRVVALRGKKILPQFIYPWEL